MLTLSCSLEDRFPSVWIPGDCTDVTLACQDLPQAGYCWLCPAVLRIGSHQSGSQEIALMSPFPVRMYLKQVDVDSVLHFDCSFPAVWIPGDCTNVILASQDVHQAGWCWLCPAVLRIGSHQSESQETALMSPLPVRIYLRQVDVDSVL